MILDSNKKTRIIEKLIGETFNDIIEWERTIGYPNFETFRYRLQLTKRKFLEFNIFIRLNDIGESYINIYFSKNKENDKEYLGIIKCTEESLLYDLVDMIVGKTKSDEIEYEDEE